MVQAIWYGNPSDGNGAGNPLRQTLWVDGSADATGANGSYAKPFKTIQAAINAVPINTTIAQAQRQWSILIAPGSYDEDITKPAGTNIALIGLGAFDIGTYTGVAPTSIRNVTLNYAAQLDGLSESFTICTIDSFNHSNPNSTALILPRITGNIVANSVAGAFANLQVMGRVEGGIDASGFAVGAQFSVNARDLTVAGAVFLPGTATRMLIAERCLFLGLLTTSTYNFYMGTSIRAGMTVLTAPNLLNAGNRPAGMEFCDLAGVFTGPANSVVVDGCTNDTFVRNGASLAGAATKILRGGIERTRRVTADPVLVVGNNGQTILADTTLGAFPVTLPTAVGNDDLYFTIKNVALAGGFAATITPVGGQFIDGAASLALAQATNDGVKIVAQGGNWWALARNP